MPPVMPSGRRQNGFEPSILYNVLVNQFQVFVENKQDGLVCFLNEDFAFLVFEHLVSIRFQPYLFG